MNKPNWLLLKEGKKSWKGYFLMEKIIQSTRSFFNELGYHEVQTPLMVPTVIPEPYLSYFETTLYDRLKNPYKRFLTTSPEASLKKLLVAGIGDVFEITKGFRNGETHSTIHNCEFTILEWYHTGVDYKRLMDECERLIISILRNIKKGQNSGEGIQYQITYQGKNINMTPIWKRLSVCEAIEKYAGISLDEITHRDGTDMDSVFSNELIASVAQKKGYQVWSSSSWEELFNQIFLNEVEPHLYDEDIPVFLYDYPKPMAALAKIKDDDPRLAERFELYIGGLELGDCYTELTDAKEQRVRFLESLSDMKQNAKKEVSADGEFLQALEMGLPPCAGMAMGIDRLAMLFADTKNISDVIYFPV